VDPECPDAYLATINYGAYWSFDGACPSTQYKVTSCKYTAASTNACACINVDSSKQWSWENKTKLGVGYGSSCKAWDMSNCNDPKIYGPQWVDTWCCENWCWTGANCKNAIASKMWVGLYWTSVDCPDDPKKTSQCPFKAQVKLPGSSLNNPYCRCIGWSPKVLNSGRRRQAGRPAYPD
jgi:hypothetical protein